MTYRDAAARMPDDPKPRQKGPLDKCPMCDTVEAFDRCSPIFKDHRGPSAAVACMPNRRIATGLFKRCQEYGAHLHQHCHSCGFRWIRDPKTEIE